MQEIDRIDRRILQRDGRITNLELAERIGLLPTATSERQRRLLRDGYVTGFEYLLKTRVRDMAAYRVFLGGVLLGLPGVHETRTYAVMEEVKDDGPLPVS